MAISIEPILILLHQLSTTLESVLSRSGVVLELLALVHRLTSLLGNILSSPGDRNQLVEQGFATLSIIVTLLFCMI